MDGLAISLSVDCGRTEVRWTYGDGIVAIALEFRDVGGVHTWR